MLKVENMISSRGNKVPNQFIIKVGDSVYFQSYNSIIAKVEKGSLTLGLDWNYSVTTSKYLRLFLYEFAYKYYSKTKKELQQLIDSGEINYIPQETWD